MDSGGGSSGGGRDDFERKRNYKENKNKTVVWVGNLSFKYTERELEEEFTPFGKILSLEIPKDPDNRSKGFGFIEYDKPEDAEAAIKKKHLTTLDGRNITVELSGRSSTKPRPERRFDDEPRGRRYDDRSSSSSGGGGGGYQGRRYDDDRGSGGGGYQKRSYDDDRGGGGGGGYQSRRYDDRSSGGSGGGYQKKDSNEPYERRDPPPRRDYDDRSGSSRDTRRESPPKKE